MRGGRQFYLAYLNLPLECSSSRTLEGSSARSSGTARCPGEWHSWEKCFRPWGCSSETRSSPGNGERKTSPTLGGRRQSDPCWAVWSKTPCWSCPPRGTDTSEPSLPSALLLQPLSVVAQLRRIVLVRIQFNEANIKYHKLTWQRHFPSPTWSSPHHWGHPMGNTN